MANSFVLRGSDTVVQDLEKISVNVLLRKNSVGAVVLGSIVVIR